MKLQRAAKQMNGKGAKPPGAGGLALIAASSWHFSHAACQAHTENTFLKNQRKLENAIDTMARIVL